MSGIRIDHMKLLCDLVTEMDMWGCILMDLMMLIN